MKGRALFYEHGYESMPTPEQFSATNPNTRPLQVRRTPNGLVAVPGLVRSVIHHRPRSADLPIGESLYEFGAGQANSPATLELALNALNAYCPPGYDGYDPVSRKINVASRTAYELHARFAQEILSPDEPATAGIILPHTDIYLWMEVLRPGLTDRIVNSP